MARTTIMGSLHRLTHGRCSELRNRHFLMGDVLAFCLTPLLALLLRVDEPHALVVYLPELVVYTLVALVTRLAIFYPFGLYWRYWRYATVDDLLQITRATITATAALTIPFLVHGVFTEGGFSLPRSLPLLDGLLAFFVVGGTRFSVRLAHSPARLPDEGKVPRVLILGAGAAGCRIARELQSNAELGLRAVGFLDDDPRKHGVQILGLPVLGGRECLVAAVGRLNAAQAIIAIPSAPGKTIRELRTLCEEAGVPAKTVPSMTAMLDGRISPSQLRNVDIEDLLRREPIRTDISAVQDLIRGKRVLVTGGGGSIGSELCRQVLRFGPAELAFLGHGENSIFEIHQELRGILRGREGTDPELAAREPSPALHPIIADIRSAERVQSVFHSFRPDIVLHAAAHKHVPLMESHPVEATSNNILGTHNLLQAALSFDVPHFVMISTDKAVNPSSVMGASKRAAEQLVLRAARQSGKPYVVVRFGNVLGSRGSAVLTFKRQIAEGGPVTVTHPEMTRYFITIPEAVQLVLQASVLGKGGEIFVLDMGSPIKIVDLVRDLIELSGLHVNRDIDIVYTGVRKGEKLHEELFGPGERFESTAHEKIRIHQNATARVLEPQALSACLSALEQAVECDDAGMIPDILQTLVPEFRPDTRTTSPLRGREAAALLPPALSHPTMDHDGAAVPNWVGT